MFTPIARNCLEDYSGTPLPQKLGTKKNSVVSLVHAPAVFLKTLSEHPDLPDGVNFHNRPVEGASVTVWFSRDLKQLEQEIDEMFSSLTTADYLSLGQKRPRIRPTDLSESASEKLGYPPAW